MKNFEASMVELEGRARVLRNGLRVYTHRDARAYELQELSDIVTQLIQAVRQDRHV